MAKPSASKSRCSLEDARRIVTDYVAHYNHVRLHMGHRLCHTNDLQAPRQGRRRSTPHATANWPRPANAARSCGKPGVTSRSETPARNFLGPPIDFAAMRAYRHHHRPGARTLGLQCHAPTTPASNARPALSTARRPGTARCFSVNTNAHTFHCFKCSRSGNGPGLVGRGQPPVDLRCRHRLRCQRLNIPLRRSWRRRQPRTEKRNP